MLHFVAVDADGEVLGHFAAFHSFKAHRFQGVAEVDERLVIIQLATEFQAPRPGENAGDGVRGGGLAGLVVAVVAGHGAVGGFGFHRAPVGRHQRGRHRAQRAEALGHGSGLLKGEIIIINHDFNSGRVHGQRLAEGAGLAHERAAAGAGSN